MKYIPNVRTIIDVMSDKNYQVFNNNTEEKINIIGIRTKDNTSNAFNDWLCVFYRDRNWVKGNFQITTDPGLYYRLNPMNIKGTAIMKPGQYKNLWELGEYKGYLALKQKAPCTVIRDNNKDKVLDFDCGVEDTGIFGIHMHRSNKWESKQIDKWSAGCQVHKAASGLSYVTRTCLDIFQKTKLNSFSYTLLLEEDF